MKRVWFGIRNILMALIVAGIGSASATANNLNSLIMTLVGICFILGGLNSFQKTSLWVSILLIALGIGAISMGETVLKDNEISYYISVGLLAVLGFFQLKKIFDSYGRKRWQSNLLKLLALLYPLCIIAGAIFSVLLQNRTAGTAFFEAGALGWIVHTVLVLTFEKQPVTTGGKKNKSTGSSNYKSAGAGRGSVTDKMRSLANYLTGGFDTLGYGVSVKYAVSVSVTEGNIKFTLSGKLSGTDSITSEQQLNSVKESLLKAAERRSQLVLDEAQKELINIGADSEYDIEVVGGDIS